jgi:hypothetical protein
MAWPYLTAPFGDCFWHFYLFNFCHSQDGEEEVHPKALRS